MHYNSIKNCFSCQLRTDDKRKLILFETDYWEVLLHPIQHNWLGRCIFVCKRHILDPDAMTKDEREDLYLNRLKIAKVYRDVFDMQHDNWATTMDHSQTHLYYQLTPSYQKDKQFDSPLDNLINQENRISTLEELQKLKNEIQRHLVKQRLISKATIVDTLPSNEISRIFARRRTKQIASTLSSIGFLAIGSYLTAKSLL